MLSLLRSVGFHSSFVFRVFKVHAFYLPMSRSVPKDEGDKIKTSKGLRNDARFIVQLSIFERLKLHSFLTLLIMMLGVCNTNYELPTLNVHHATMFVTLIVNEALVYT